jgi:hypothetical protein
VRFPLSISYDQTRSNSLPSLLVRNSVVPSGEKSAAEFITFPS